MTSLTRSCLLAICAIATTSLAAVPPLDAAAPGRRTTQTTAAPPAIAVGYCAPLAELAQAKAAGFDYVELRTTEFAGMTDAAFDEAVARAARIGLPTPVSNLFLARAGAAVAAVAATVGVSWWSGGSAGAGEARAL